MHETQAFASSWHILMKGAIIAAAEGDPAAARHAKEMGRSLIDRHSRPDAAAAVELPGAGA